MGFIQRYQDGEYLSRTQDWHEGDAAWKAARVREILDAAGLAPRRVADAGCGTGGVLVQLQATMPPGVELTGFEVAEPAFRVAAARANAGLRFVHGGVEEHRGEPFDVLLAMDVFEHVPDYLGFLELLRPVARRFVFHVPLDLSIKSLLTGLPMHRRRSVGHLHYFDADTARATLEDCGYRVLDARFTHAVMQPPPATWKQRVRRLPDRLLYAARPALCARVLGGCSLLVLAEPDEVPALSPA
ncbi:class I SAM-dependent methyltransferase [Sphingomonas lenta]|uniref:class I SAM-dependent methyltransferase n=1 Tax=Sphingomonas lenta TaxID=1141887 RepID=UPI0015950135|nr:methyltransferase domain-containing protein [Sphingomonas lenta]